MNETQIWIEDAIKGGWCDLMKGIPFEIIGGDIVTKTDKGFNSLFENVSVVLLDPKAWEAVGEVRGWDWAYCYTCKSRVPLWGQCECDEDEQQPEAVMAWHRNWHRFIDHLAEGKTIEQALLAIK